MLQSDPWIQRRKAKFLHLLRTFACDYNADMVFGCEIGGHRQGLTSAMLRNLEPPNLRAIFTQNYMSAVNTTSRVRLVRDPSVTELVSAQVCEPQLVLTAVQMENDLGKAAMMVVGNLRVRTPSGPKTPSMATRLRTVKEALRRMTEYAEMVMRTQMSAAERRDPVLLLVGDSNLTEDLCHMCVATLQLADAKSDNDVWTVMATANGLGGDVCISRGCAIDRFEVAVGRSFRERGMRNDNHDALGLALRLPVVKSKEAKDTDDPSERHPSKAVDDLVEKLSEWLKEANEQDVAGTLTHAYLDLLEPIVQKIEAMEEQATIVRGAREKEKELREKLASKSDSCAPELADKGRTRGEAAGARNALTYGIYDTVLKYFNERMDTEGLEATDAQLDKLGKLIFSKRKVGFPTDRWGDTRRAAKMIEARRARADWNDAAIATVTKRVL